MKKLVIAVVLSGWVSNLAHAEWADPVGHVQTLRGTAVIVRGEQTLPVSVGAPIQRGDLVRTGKPGAVGIVLRDESSVSLGPGSELDLKAFTFEPQESRFSLALRMIKGTFVYFTGLIGKLAPDSVQLAVPDATIAIRGTKLLVDVRP